MELLNVCLLLILESQALFLYKYSDMRFGVADDMWLTGQNDWYNGGYSIGTPVVGMCFNIGVDGNITIPNDIKTPESMTNRIKALDAECVGIDDNVIIIGNTTMGGNITIGGSCNISNNLTVLGFSIFNQTMRIKTQSQGGGNLRIEPSVNGNEASIGYYNRSDLRITDAGDMWVSGVNRWSRVGFNIGTTVLGSCLNISNAGTISATYKIITPLLNSDILRANGATQITLDDNVIITGNLTIGRIYKYQNTHTASQTAGATRLTIAQLLNGIYEITQTAVVLLTLPTGTATYSGGFGVNQSIDWSVINTGTSVGTATVQQTTDHTLRFWICPKSYKWPF